jgi:hypothetical protein
MNPISPSLITGDMLVCDLFALSPKAREVFISYGYKGCGGPTGPAKPVSAFASNHDVELEQLLQELREAIGAHEEI